jgi:hypothetical protein
MIPQVSLSSKHQYHPGFVGAVVVRGGGACDGLSFDIVVMLGRLGRAWGGVKDYEHVSLRAEGSHGRWYKNSRLVKAAISVLDLITACPQPLTLDVYMNIS